MSAAIPGIVLAAGASRRMGRSKALLRLGASGLSFARVICDTLTAAGVSPIVVVTRAELLDSLAGVLSGTELVLNRHPERGQLSSLLAGLEALDAPEAAMMTLVDLPLVRASTVAALLATWHQTHAPLVRPLCGGRHGHPVIFGAPVLDALRSADVGEGAKPVVHRFLSNAVSVPVDDPATIEDIDTPEQYHRLGRL